MTAPSSSAHVDALSDLWLGFAEHEFGSYSPLYAGIARHVASDEDILRLVLESPPAAHQPNVLLAAVHYLVLGGMEHPLAALYSHPRPGVDPGPLFRDVCLSHRDAVLGLMEVRRTQTNECGRSALIALGLVEAAASLGEPVSLLDAGASAGLNLLFDRYFLNYGPHGHLGPEDSTVRVHCEVRGGSLRLPANLPVVSNRLGVDRSPLDLTDASDARWLLACVWPDTGRLERTSAAVELARRHPPAVRPGDMIDDLPEVMRELDSGPLVVVTSLAYAYLPADRRQAFCEVLDTEGRRRPVAWISIDSVGVVDLFDVPRASPETSSSVLGLVIYDRGAADARALALVHAHGAWVDWLERPVTAAARPAT